MALSMTGFSSLTRIIPVKGKEKISVVVEIKSLNSRFFEANCKLSSGLNFLEIQIVNDLKQKLIRGRVFLSVKFVGSGDLFEQVTLSEKAVKDYLGVTKPLQKKLKIPGDLTIAEVFRLPNVF